MKRKLVVSLIGGAMVIGISALAFGSSFGIEKKARQEAVVLQTLTYASSDYIIISTEETKTETESVSMIKSRDWDADDSELLARIAMAEAEGEPLEGKMMVICVVLNRVWNDEFPDTVEDVIYQKGQFSPVGTSRWDLEPSDECWEAVNNVQMGWDESYGALYFEAVDNTNTWHKEHLEYLFTVGNQNFYK